MEETRIIKPHHVTIMNRKVGNITGIKDVISFDLNTILLETQCGMVTVKGHDLHVSRLSVEKGEIDINDFPLLMHVDNIISNGASAEIPWDKFTFEEL